jgi:hypothetical protein
MIRDTPAPIDPHWQARLAYVQDLIFAAMAADDGKATADALGAALLQLTGLLQDDWAGRDAPMLLQLVIEAHDLLTNPETVVDLRDWTRSADRFVR